MEKFYKYSIMKKYRLLRIIIAFFTFPGVIRADTSEAPYIKIARFSFDEKSRAYQSSGYLMQVSPASNLGKSITKSLDGEQIARGGFFLSQFEDPLMVLVPDDKSGGRLFYIISSFDDNNNKIFILVERNVTFGQGGKIEKNEPKRDVNRKHICYVMSNSDVIQALIRGKAELKISEE